MSHPEPGAAAEEPDRDRIEAAWASEIGRRVEEIRSGAVEGIPLEDVLAELDAIVDASEDA